METVLATDNASLQDTDRFLLEATNACQVYDVNIGRAVTTYTYDALGRRIEKRSATGEATRFVYDGARVAEEWTLSGSSASLTASYVYGNYIDEVLTMRRGSSDYYYHADDQHNVVKLTDSNGDVVESYDYGDYGLPEFFDATGTLSTANTSSVGNPYLFTGRRWDEELGYYYYRNRYMDPALGRFVSRDPIGLWGDAANLGNGYTYAASNPWSLVDPMGLDGGNQSWWSRFWQWFLWDVVDISPEATSERTARHRSEGDQIRGKIDYNRLVDGTPENITSEQIYSAAESETGAQNRELAEEVSKRVATEAVLYYGGGAAAGVLDDVHDQYKAAKKIRQGTQILPGWSESDDLVNMQKASRKQWQSYVNPGHHDPNLPPGSRASAYNAQKQVIPQNVEDLWNRSIYFNDSTRWAIEGSGRKAVFHRFSGENGELHWNGSTSTAGAPLGRGGKPRIIQPNDVPAAIKNLLR